MYFNGFFARDYYTDTYYGVSDEGAVLVIGAYKGVYLGIYENIYARK